MLSKGLESHYITGLGRMLLSSFEGMLYVSVSVSCRVTKHQHHYSTAFAIPVKAKGSVNVQSSGRSSSEIILYVQHATSTCLMFVTVNL